MTNERLRSLLDLHVDERLWRIIEFVHEAERLKTVLRRTTLFDGSRQENVAEHSWEVSTLATLLADYASERIDVSRVMKMLLFHDVVEVYAGDTFVYDEIGLASQQERESRAADAIFSYLPADIRDEVVGLWTEFEESESDDAVFANALDRVQPLLHNYLSHGGTWRLPGVTPARVYAKKSVIRDASEPLWELARTLIFDGVKLGYFGGDFSSDPNLIAIDRDFLAIRRFSLMSSLPASVLATAKKYIDRFGIAFDRLMLIPTDFLSTIHARPWPESPAETAADRSKVEENIRRMGEIANRDAQSIEDFGAYLSSVLEIYECLPISPSDILNMPGAFCVAPKREGHLIATELGIAKGVGYCAPEMKRMLHPGAMLVGISGLEIPSSCRKLVIVDGAIASGATIMSIIQLAPRALAEVWVFSAHAANSSVAALERFSAGVGVPIHLVVGQASGVLNESYYAVESAASAKLVIGDIGDLTHKPSGTSPA